MTGTIPLELCREGSPLRVLNLRLNWLGGSMAHVARCRYLELLDLGINRFNGTLPSTAVGTAVAANSLSQAPQAGGGGFWQLGAHSSTPQLHP